MNSEALSGLPNRSHKSGEYRYQSTLLFSFFIVLFFSVFPAFGQQRLLILEGINDASLADGSGLLQIGAANDINLLFDRNEIIARNNGVISTLFLNVDGGLVKTGSVETPANFWATGYSKLGDETLTPFIKTRLVSGTTAVAGSTNLIPHGLPDQTKIIFAYVVVEQEISGSPYFEHYTVDWHDQTNVALTTNMGNNRNYKMFLTYIQ